MKCYQDCIGLHINLTQVFILMLILFSFSLFYNSGNLIQTFFSTFLLQFFHFINLCYIVTVDFSSHSSALYLLIKVTVCRMINFVQLQLVNFNFIYLTSYGVPGIKIHIVISEGRFASLSCQMRNLSVLGLGFCRQDSFYINALLRFCLAPSKL